MKYLVIVLLLFSLAACNEKTNENIEEHKEAFSEAEIQEDAQHLLDNVQQRLDELKNNDK